MTGRQFQLGVAGLLLAAAMSLSCSGDKSTGTKKDHAGPSDLPGAVEAQVIADSGAVLTTGDGIVLTIGPGALPNDTLVKLIPVEPPTLDDQFITAARMEPEGLVLNAPVRLRFPLPSGWPSDENPLVYEFLGNDPSWAMSSMAYARVTGAGDTLFAEVLMSHFSGPVCAKNCHAGTIRYILDVLQARGCNRDSVIEEVQRRYPGVAIPRDGCGMRGAETIQAFLDTYFDDVASYNDGEQTPPAMISQLFDDVLQGRQVVMAFKPGNWGVRGGAHDFFPTGALDYSHSAALELHDGQIQLRNTLATEKTDLIQALGGSNVVWYPAASLNDFRQLPDGVATELQICGSPDCLTDPSRNSEHIKAFEPVAGRSFIGQAWTDPWTYFLKEGGWSGVPPRVKPWTAVRIYVEKLDGPQNQLCSGPLANSFVADVDIPGKSGVFQPASIYAGFGERDNEVDLPAIQATTDITPDPSSFRFYDFLNIIFAKTLEAQGTYDFSDGSSPEFKVVLWYSTPVIEDDDTGYPTTFLSQSGTLRLGSFGATRGSRVSGSFTVQVHGDQMVRNGTDFDSVPIDGTLDGSFDVVLSATSAANIQFRSASFAMKKR
jgi:hypothetical protein